MKRFLPLLALLLTFAAPVLHADPEDDRVTLIRGLQDLRRGKGGAAFEEKTGEIAELIAKGDEGLAYQATLSGASMLDNEAYFAVLANAVLHFPARVLQALESTGADTRKQILDVCKGNGQLAFEDPAQIAKFNKTVEDLITKSAKIEDKIRLTDGRAAYIDDPDGYTNLRLEPNTKAPIIDRIISGEEFLVIAEKGDWCTVNSPRGDLGYLHKSRVHYKFADK
jgi:hypothetical protein